MMAISIRLLATSALLAATMATFTGPATAASLDVAAANLGAKHSAYARGGRHLVLRAPDELIRGVRGASPLTVPFFGAGWYPGPAHYYGPRHSICCRGQDAVISVKY
jgi:hypothetical protein